MIDLNFYRKFSTHVLFFPFSQVCSTFLSFSAFADDAQLPERCRYAERREEAESFVKRRSNNLTLSCVCVCTYVRVLSSYLWNKLAKQERKTLLVPILQTDRADACLTVFHIYTLSNCLFPPICYHSRPWRQKESHFWNQEFDFSLFLLHVLFVFFPCWIALSIFFELTSGNVCVIFEGGGL